MIDNTLDNTLYDVLNMAAVATATRRQPARRPVADAAWNEACDQASGLFPDGSDECTAIRTLLDAAAPQERQRAPGLERRLLDVLEAEAAAMLHAESGDQYAATRLLAWARDCAAGLPEAWRNAAVRIAEHIDLAALSAAPV